MSINHYSSSDLAQSQWWSHYMNMDSPAQNSSPTQKPTHSALWLSPHHLYHPNAAAAAAAPMFPAHNNAVSFDLNNEDDYDESEHVVSGGAAAESEARAIPKDRLFEKPLTPSDVGKLNRLVIPKQHAEKHFPLNGGDSSGENGLLLGFEDELGKSWRFRYSYWNSSQSYVLTKGWSRFVKEKRLDAGDIVVFARHRVDAGRMFIGWRRRNSSGQDANANANSSQAVVGSGGGGGWNRLYYSAQPYPNQQQQQQGPSSSVPNYQPDHCRPAGSSSVSQNQTGGNNLKRLRLFGVNMECHQPDESEPSTPVGSPMSSQGAQPPHYHPYHHHQFYSNNNNHHNMDISFSGADVYRQG